MAEEQAKASVREVEEKPVEVVVDEKPRTHKHRHRHSEAVVVVEQQQQTEEQKEEKKSEATPVSESTNPEETPRKHKHKHKHRTEDREQTKKDDAQTESKKEANTELPLEPSSEKIELVIKKEEQKKEVAQLVIEKEQGNEVEASKESVPLKTEVEKENTEVETGSQADKDKEERKRARRERRERRQREKELLQAKEAEAAALQAKEAEAATLQVQTPEKSILGVAKIENDTQQPEEKQEREELNSQKEREEVNSQKLTDIQVTAVTEQPSVIKEVCAKQTESVQEELRENAEKEKLAEQKNQSTNDTKDKPCTTFPKSSSEPETPPQEQAEAKSLGKPKEDSLLPPPPAAPLLEEEDGDKIKQKSHNAEECPLPPPPAAPLLSSSADWSNGQPIPSTKDSSSTPDIIPKQNNELESAVNTSFAPSKDVTESSDKQSAKEIENLQSKDSVNVKQLNGDTESKEFKLPKAPAIRENSSLTKQTSAPTLQTGKFGQRGRTESLVLLEKQAKDAFISECSANKTKTTEEIWESVFGYKTHFIFV